MARERAVVEGMAETESPSPLHGDILEEVVSRVPSLDLVPSSLVSKAWSAAVTSSFPRSSRRRIPWLLLRLQPHYDPSAPILTFAFDPHSRDWIHIPRSPPTAHSSSHPGLLYTLSLSTLSFSTDPLGFTWRELRGPKIARGDPVVALVGSRIVVAGGAWDFEGDPCSVEVCDVVASGGLWEDAEPMPDAFRGSAAATWLSVAASDKELLVLEKREGLLSSFDPETKRWGKTNRLRLDPAVFLSAIGLAGDRLILVGAAGGPTEVESVKLWEVDRESMELTEMGTMPPEMVKGMVGDGWGLSSAIGFSLVGGYGYSYNPSDMREAFLCDFGEVSCGWTSAGSPAALEQDPMKKVVFSCSAVGLGDLKRAVRSPPA